MADQAVTLNYDLAPSPQLQSKLQRQMADLERNLKFKTPFGQGSRDVRDFGTELDRANQRVITLGASFAILATSIRTLKGIVSSTIEVEKAFTEINAVVKLGAQDLDVFSKKLFDAARNAGQGFDKAAEAAQEFSRQGLTANEIIKRTTDALTLSRLANLGVAESVDTLTASINGFQKSALTSSEIVNKLATVDARFAVSSKDLAEALSRSGAAASDAGIGFDQLIGLITAAQQTTARGGPAIGNALKSIFTRVEKRDTIDAFESLGVAVKDAQGNMLTALPLLKNFSDVYDTLTGTVQKQAAAMVGGVYQINILKAVLNDLAKAQGIAATATDVSANATDEATQRNEALNKSLSATLERLAVTGKQIGANVGNLSFANPLKNLIGIGLDNPITAALEDASGKAETTGGKIAEGLLKGIGGTLIYGLGPLVTAALAKVVIKTGGNVLKDFGNLTPLNNQGQQEAAVQREVVALYQAGGEALQRQLATMTSITEQAAYLQGLLRSQGTNNAAQIARVMVGSRAAAGGYIPMGAESAAIAAGIGGAPSSAKPVYLPGFNRGGGETGIVANNSEWMVKGAAGGAIFNRDMIQKYGLPPGATPVAAGGHIPNAANNYNVPPSYRNGAPISPQVIMGIPVGSPYSTYPGPASSASAMGQGFGQYSNPMAGNGANTERQLAQAFEKAQAELQKIQQAEADALIRKEQDMEKGFTLLEKKRELSSAERSLTTEQISLSEQVLAATQQLYQSARNRAPLPTPYGPTATPQQIALANMPVNKPGDDRISESAREAMDARSESYRRTGSNIKRPWTPELEAQAARRERMEAFHAGMAADIADQGGVNQVALSLPAAATTSKRTMLSRLKGAFTGENAGRAGLAAAFALPFIGSQINEGQGGTTSGMVRGGLAGALNGAGFGASAGMLFGPVGAAVGAGVGGILGGAYGAIKKMEGSFEELATAINEAHAKIQRQVEFVQDAFQQQENVVNLIQSNATPAKIDAARRQRTQSIMSISDPAIREKAIASINDPNGRGDITDLLTDGLRKNQLAENVGSTTRRVLDTGGFTRGALGYGDNASSDLAKALLPALSGMDREHMLAAGKMNEFSPRGAFRSIAGSAGMSEKQIDDFTNRQGGNTTELFQDAINKAFRSLTDSGIVPLSEAFKKAEKEAASFQTSLKDLSAKFELQSKIVVIRADAEQKVLQNAHQLFMATGGMTAAGIAQAEGAFGKYSASAAFDVQGQSLVNSGKMSLIKSLGKDAKGKDSEGLRNKLSGLNSQSDFEALLADANSGTGIKGLPGVGTEQFKEALEEVIVKFKELSESQDAEIRAIDQITKERVDDYNTRGTREGAASQYGSEAYLARQNLERSITRNDPIDTINELQSKLRAANLTRGLQGGAINQAQFDRGIFAGGLQDSVGALRRENRAMTGKGIEDFRVGNNLDMANGQLDRRLIDNPVNLRTARGLNDADAERKVLSEGKALELDSLRIKGDIDSRQQKILQGIDDEDEALKASIRDNEVLLRITQERHGQLGSIISLLERGDALELESQFRSGKINEDQYRRQLAASHTGYTVGNKYSSGAEISSATFADAKEAGLQGDSKSSFTGGFHSVFAGLKRDMLDLSDLGKNLADSLSSNLGGAWGDFITGAKQGKDAFRSFVTSVLGDASRMLGTKAIQGILSMIPGFANASGGPIGFANGGMVPAMLTGGEFVVGPRAAQRIGRSTLQKMNGYAEGGMVRGGSGVRDDVHAMLPPGSFVIRKSATQRIGEGNLSSMVNGAVQRRDIGGPIWGTLLGALLGGGLGAAAGGKKGAIGGALLGGIAGGLYGQSSSANAGPNSVSNNIAGMGTTLSIGQKGALALGASAGLGLLAAGIGAPGSSSGPITADQVPAYRAQLEAAQNTTLAGRGPGQQVFLQVNPQGGYSLSGFGDAPATRRWDSGGGVDMPITPRTGGPGPDYGSGGGGACANVSIKIDVNNNGSATSSSQGEPLGDGSGARLERVVKGWVQEEIVRQSRSDGFFTQRSRYVNNA